MSTFLTGDELNDAIDDVIINTKKFLFITSPYIKLDDHFKERFDLIKNDPSIYLHILFGKNEDDFYKSVNSDDLEYFKSFPNVSIIYEPRLHAKSYVNESQGIITSMNLYDYSAENNVEYGVGFSKSRLNEKVYEEHLDVHDELLEKSAHCIFIQRPVYKKALLGLSKTYLRSQVLLDLFDSFNPRERNYERIVYQDIDIVSLDDKEVIPLLKSRSEKRQEEMIKRQQSNTYKKKKVVHNSQTRNNQEIGYCIRTGEEIPFNPKKPMSYNAYRSWLKYANFHYKESYCHQTGQKSGKKTSMKKPILNSDYENEERINGRFL
ncbi:hypothetical protein BBFL7_02178 [Flavobacteria bacterium BBFL7]|nr:hypothetical protein BBFL7_02178 [Flavobacteria bacterium BBFL7]